MKQKVAVDCQQKVPHFATRQDRTVQFLFILLPTTIFIVVKNLVDVQNVILRYLILKWIEKPIDFIGPGLRYSTIDGKMFLISVIILFNINKDFILKYKKIFIYINNLYKKKNKNLCS